MKDLENLLTNLKSSGISVPKSVEKAMHKIDIRDFTDFDFSGFYHDRPVVFLKSASGGSKNISAPHMIVTLLHNLELGPGQQIIVYGAKGGYISALIAHIIGEDGRVTVIDPSMEVINQVSMTLRGYPTVECYVSTEIENLELSSLNRVLVTGQLEVLPDWLSKGLDNGGFVVAPIGKRSSQRLMKIERQEDSLFETDLGSVVFGPVDIADTSDQTPSPSEMAEMIEQVIDLMSDSGFVEQDKKTILYDLVAELRQLPDDLPPPEQMEDPNEHPMIELMMKKGEWFLHIWPFIQSLMETRIVSFDSVKDNEGGDSHSDFIP